MKTKSTQTTNGRDLKLTPEVESSEELIGKETVENIKAFRKKNPKADLSIYTVKAKE